MAQRTFGTLIAEARTLLQDKVQADGYRYSDDEMFEAINGALSEARVKRPDVFLDMGLRNPLPFYTAEDDMNTAFPFDISLYNPMLYYLVGRSELREDTFSDNGRATVLMNKFVSQLMGPAS
jgi:hypothetical protein